jgi:hypothetical protein
MRLLDLRRRLQLLNRRVVQNRPNRQGVGRDPSTNRTSVRTILSVPLIISPSRAPYLMNPTHSEMAPDASSSRDCLVWKISTQP